MRHVICKVEQTSNSCGVLKQKAIKQQQQKKKEKKT